jgi:N-acetyl-gamma-glutamyl-phosphate reductase
MTQTVFIDGAVGTTGLEIRDRLANRGEFDLIVLDEAQRKDTAARREALNAADFAILCLPDDAAIDAVDMIDQASRTRIIDASSAHRVAANWTYGLPELTGRSAVSQARLVSNPGCYPTGFLALVAPLVRAGLLPADWPFSVNAVSGYSGGGKALIARFEEDQTDLAFRAYGLGFGHKHVAEMQRHAGLTHAPLFAPAVIPAFRGMHVEVPLPLGAIPGTPSPDALRDCLREFYADSAVVNVSDDIPGELLLHAQEQAHDDMQLMVFASDDGTQARLVARLDNLGKGASGAAVQNLNLMAGLDETKGLRLPR